MAAVSLPPSDSEAGRLLRIVCGMLRCDSACVCWDCRRPDGSRAWTGCGWDGRGVLRAGWTSSRRRRVVALSSPDRAGVGADAGCYTNFGNTWICLRVAIFVEQQARDIGASGGAGQAAAGPRRPPPPPQCPSGAVQRATAYVIHNRMPHDAPPGPGIEHLQIEPAARGKKSFCARFVQQAGSGGAPGAPNCLRTRAATRLRRGASAVPPPCAPRRSSTGSHPPLIFPRGKLPTVGVGGCPDRSQPVY